MGDKVCVRDSLLLCMCTCMCSMYCVTDIHVDRNKVAHICELNLAFFQAALQSCRSLSLSPPSLHLLLLLLLLALLLLLLRLLLLLLLGGLWNIIKKVTLLITIPCL